jgi:FkbM family methyltransferase
MKKFKIFFNFLLHKIIKSIVDAIVYKKTFLYNFFIKNLSLGDFCYSYYSVKLNHVDFRDATFRFACGGAYGNYLNTLIKKYEKEFFFLDIGANIGIFSLIAKNNKYCKKIIAIEPSKLIYKKLKKNLSSKKCVLYNLAISNFNGVADLSINTNHSGISKLISKKDKKKYKSQKVITKNYKFFDMIYKKLKPYNLIVKIDVEGHQLSVIKEIKKSKIYNDISLMYIENENNYEAKIKLQKMLPKFKLIKIDKIINFKDSNINMVFEKKRKNEK